jgi:hypothetical protein
VLARGLGGGPDAFAVESGFDDQGVDFEDAAGAFAEAVAEVETSEPVREDVVGAGSELVEGGLESSGRNEKAAGKLVGLLLNGVLLALVALVQRAKSTKALNSIPAAISRCRT